MLFSYTINSAAKFASGNGTVHFNNEKPGHFYLKIVGNRKHTIHEDEYIT